MEIKNKIYYMPINGLIDKTIFNKLLSFISNENKEKIKNYRFDIDKKLKLYADILIRVIVCQTLRLNNFEIEFEKEDYGKPYIRDASNFHYNISHTKNAIVIAISKYPIGVDIEKAKKNDMNLRIAKRFFTSNEQAQINKNEYEKDKLFYKIWTKKEAYIKYIGKGLTMPLNSFDVLDSDISKHIYTFEKNDYIISVCYELMYQQYEIIEISENQAEERALSLLMPDYKLFLVMR